MLSTMILVMYQLFLMAQYHNFITKVALHHALETLAQLFDSFQYSTQYVLFPCCSHFLVFVNTDKYRLKKDFNLQKFLVFVNTKKYPFLKERFQVVWNFLMFVNADKYRFNHCNGIWCRDVKAALILRKLSFIIAIWSLSDVSLSFSNRYTVLHLFCILLKCISMKITVCIYSLNILLR